MVRRCRWRTVLKQVFKFGGSLASPLSVFEEESWSASLIDGSSWGSVAQELERLWRNPGLCEMLTSFCARLILESGLDGRPKLRSNRLRAFEVERLALSLQHSLRLPFLLVLVGCQGTVGQARSVCLRRGLSQSVAEFRPPHLPPSFTACYHR